MLFFSLDKNIQPLSSHTEYKYFYDIALEQICDIFLLERMKNKNLLGF